MMHAFAAMVCACALALVLSAPAHAVATIAADTTRSPLGDPVAAGRSPSIGAGLLDRTLLRFSVRGIGGPPARAVLRLRVTDPTIENVGVRVIPPAFEEDARTPALLLAPLFALTTAKAPTAGAWVEWDVTKAVTGDGDVGLQVSGPLLDAVAFSSREGPDAPQLVVTPDDARAVRLAALLEPRTAETFAADVHDDQGSSMDTLDVIDAPPGLGVPGRYIGVHHTLVGGVFVTKLATSDNLTTWTHRADLDVHAGQATLAALPDGGFVLAVERDQPDPMWVSANHISLRHYASWAALAVGASDRVIELPRTLAPTAEGTPALEILSWTDVDHSQIKIRFHYFKDINVDRQASGVLTNFSPADWAPQPDAAVNALFVGLGTRGNLGDRADLTFEGHAFAVIEAQSVKSNFGTWRWYLYDRERNEARLLALRLPAGSWALGNPTVRQLKDPAGLPLLFVSGFVFSQGAGAGEAGQFVALRHLPVTP
jgi:hypothetical protein